MLPSTPAFLEGINLLGGEEELAPLPLGHLAPGSTLPFHVFVADGISPGGFVLAYRQGQVCPAETGEGGWGYFAMSEAGEVLDYLLSRVEETQDGGEQDTLDPLRLLADTLLIFTQYFYCHEASRTVVGLASGRGLITRLDRCLGGGGPALETVGRLRRHDSGLFSHCLNVCLLALAFLQHLSWDEAGRETFALGALLHDLGRMPRARTTFYQTPLTDEDWEDIRAHPHRGAALLESLQPLPEDVLNMVRQHHESTDGSGYPQGLTGDAIHSWARILKILDSFEALTSFRPWRPPINERQVFRIMTSAWSAQGGYDQESLRHFLTFFGGK